MDYQAGMTSEISGARVRSLRAGETSVDELRALTKAFGAAEAHFEGDPTEWAYDSVVVDGDLVIEGNLSTFERGWATLVVTGSLHVTGHFRDCDDPATAVFVLGAMRAERVVTSGALCVAGARVVDELLAGDMGEHSADIRGDVTARFFVPENHHFEIGGTLRADAVLGDGADSQVPKRLAKAAKPMPRMKLREILVDDVLDIYEDDDGNLENLELLHDELLARARQGLPIARSEPSA